MSSGMVLSCLVLGYWSQLPDLSPASEVETARIEEVRAQLERKSYSNDGEQARDLAKLVALCREAGRYEEALPYARRLIALREQLVAEGQDGPQALAMDLKATGNLYLELADYDKAKDYYERALALQRQILGPEHADTADTIYNIAITLRRMGRFADARPLYAKVLSIKEKELGRNSPGLAFYLNGFGVFLYYSGDFAGARDCYERVLDIRRADPHRDDLEVAGVLTNLGFVLQDMGDLADAKPYLEEALAIRRRLLPPDHPLLGQSLQNLGACLARQGHRDAARKLYEQALPILEKALPPGHPRIGTQLIWLADLLVDAGDYAGARPLYQRALSISKGTQDEDWCLNGLGVVLERTGQPELSKRLFEQALQIRERVLGPRHPLVAVVVRNLAATMARTGATEEALRLALRAEALSRDHLLLTTRALAERQAILYAAARVSGRDLAISLAAADPGGDINRRAWDTVIRSRALVLDQMVSRRRLMGQHQGDAGRRLLEEVAATSRDLAGLTVRGYDAERPHDYRVLLRRAVERKEDAERALARASPAFRAQDSSRASGMDEVARSLPSGTALVAFVKYLHQDLGHGALPDLGVPSYAAFILGPRDSSPRLERLGPAREIDALVSRWREIGAARAAWRGTPEEAETAHRRTGEALRQRVWDPVARILGQSRRVLVVPDGALQLVSLAALPVGRSEYLVETAPPIHYLSAERDLVAPAHLSDQKRGILILGGPDFGSKAPVAVDAKAALETGEEEAPFECPSYQTLEFGPLPAATGEVEQVETLWRRMSTPGGGPDGESPDVLRLTGFSASEAAFKELAPGRRFLHIATHGFFLEERCALSPDAMPEQEAMRGIGGLVSAAARSGDDAWAHHPLRLSGLALAGANRRRATRPDEEDGILTADEIATMDLDGVEWAVLSACDTGVGEVQTGEGVLGLRRAFSLAGARTVIMSLWPVEDLSTGAWMRALYEGRLLTRLDTPEAVRQAGLTVIRQRRAEGLDTHPFYWGSWVAVGDPR